MNDYGETDYQIDLFAEIEKGYENMPCIFDNIKSDDMILAFFPCVRFENQIMLSFRGQLYGMDKWSNKKKMQHDMKLLDELNHNYKLVNKLFILCLDRGHKMIMENPYSEEHFLRRYWCYPPTMIDGDRRRNGDYFKKPTQYWFVNCEPENNILLEPIEHIDMDTTDIIRFMGKKERDLIGAKSIKQARSMIHPQYANRFIRQYILKEE